MRIRQWLALLVFPAAVFVAESCGSSHVRVEDPDASLPQHDGGAPDAGVDDAGTPDGGPVVVRTWPPDRPGYVNPIVAENQKPGNSNWNRFIAKARNGEINGYADHVSAKAGDTVNVMISASVPSNATWTLYRLGWYGGDGARSVATGTMTVAPQAACPPDPVSGLVRCSWTPTFSVQIKPEYVSGLYLFKLVRNDDYASYVPLVITDSRPADLLMQASVLTYQAYNDWGGTSLYTDGPLSLPWKKAVEVSFDRPYSEDIGAGEMIRYDSLVARWLEKYGYDVAYTTNLDVAVQGKQLLMNHGAFLSVGHDEYWSKSIRDAVEGARDEGVSLFFLTANTAYWQVRLDGDVGNGPRHVTAWKESWPNDPDQGPEITSRYRDWPINRPENGLLGVMLTNWGHLSFPFVPADTSHWLFEGTGLRDGDAIPWLMGYETDARVDNGFQPAGLEVLSHSTVLGVEGSTGTTESTVYRNAQGALVFASGTIEWCNGLGAQGVKDSRVERMTANLIHEAIGVPVPSNLHVSPPQTRINGPLAQNVSTIATGLGAITSVAVMKDGGLAVADPNGNRILRIGPAPARDVSVLAGTGSSGNSNWFRPTPGSNVEFNSPTSVIADIDGRIIVADTRNHCIREIADDPDHTVTTIAGKCGEPDFQDGACGSARFMNPMGMTIDPITTDIVVADSWNHRIRGINRATNAVRTIAGSELGDQDGPAATALFYYPTDVTADPSGRLYVAAPGDFMFYKIDNDPVRTTYIIVTGQQNANDGDGNHAGLAVHLGLGWTNGYVIASDGSANRIRRIAPDPNPDFTEVSTLAGKGRYGLIDGPGDTAGFAMPSGLAVGPDGTIYVADTGNGAVRAIQP